MTRERGEGYPVSWKAHLHDLPRSGRRLSIRAGAAERAAIARYADLPEVSAFDADLALSPASGGGVRVSGTLRADVVQSCVVSLRPVADSLEIEIHRSFAPVETRRRGRGGEEAGEVIVAYDEVEPPEPLPPGDLDLAEILVEEFLLALNPYPRHPQAVLGPAADDEEEADKARGPFAGLAALKGGKKGQKS